MRSSKLRILVTLFIIVFLLGACTIKPPPSPVESYETEDNMSVDNKNENNQYRNEKRELVFYVSDYFKHDLICTTVQYKTDLKFSYVQNSDMGFVGDLLPQLLSGNSVPDLYLLQSNEDYAHKLIKKGIYHDLSQYPELMASYDKMFPSIKEGCTINEEVFGFPIYVLSDGYLRYSTFDLQMLDYKPEDFTTLDALMTFHHEWEKNRKKKGGIAIRPDYIVDQVIFRYILNRYNYDNYHVDIDTDEFRDVLKYAKQVYDSQITRNIYNQRDFSIVSWDRISTGTGNTLVSMPQVKGHNDKQVLKIEWLVINPNSKNIDAAVDLLKILAEWYKAAVLYTILYDDEDFYKSAKYISIDTRTFMVGYMEALKELYNDHKLLFGFPGKTLVKKTIMEYLNNNKTLDGAVKEAQRIIDLTSKEQRLG